MKQKTSTDLRDILFAEIDELRAGRSTPARARAVAALANGILQSVFAEIDYHRALHTNGELAPLTPITLSVSTEPSRLRKAA